MVMIVSEYTGRHNKRMFNLLDYNDLHDKSYMSLVYFFNVNKGNKSNYLSLKTQGLEMSASLMEQDKKDLSWGIE